VVGKLLEREALVSALTVAVGRGLSGSGSVSFVVGEAGLGKTSLLRFLEDHARVKVALGEGVAAEAAVPFGLLSQAFGSLEGFDELGALEGLASTDGRAAFYYRSTRWLEQSARAAPLLLLLDDVHWADPDSLGLLGFLCRRLAGWAVAVVATMRPWPAESLLLADTLVSEGRATIEQLAPLGESAAAAVLAEAAGRQLTEQETTQALQSCCGNPFLLAQSGTALRPRSRSAAWTGREARLLISRFSGLSSSALHVTQAVSVLGTRFRPLLVATVAEMSKAETEQAIEALVEAGLVVELTYGQAEFVHPLFAQVVYDDIAEIARSRMHRLAMRALVDSGADPAQAATHARAGHLMGEPEVIGVLEAAGKAALAVGGVESALVNLRHAVEIAGPKASPSLLLTLADTEGAAGHAERAEVLCHRLLAGEPDAHTRPRVMTVLARAAAVGGQPDQVERWFEAAATAAREDPEQLISVLGEAAATCTTFSAPGRILAWVEQSRELLDAQPSADRGVNEAAWALIAGMTGDPSGVAAVLATLDSGSFEAGMATTSPSLATWMAINVLGIAKLAERLEISERLFAAGWKRAQRVGSPALIASVSVAYADNLVRLGRLAQALELIQSVEEVNLGPRSVGQNPPLTRS
jgi:hypothetical protein